MSDYLYGRIWLFHPSGAKLELALPSNYPEEAFNYINECLTAGFLATPPDNAALDRLDVAYAVRCQFTHKGELKTRLYFYKSYGEMGSDMTVYLDNADDVAKFERFSGLKLADMPIYEGDAAPQRTGGAFTKYAKPVNFTVTREKEAPSQKYANGRWVLVDYVSGGAPLERATSPKNGDFSHVATTSTAAPQNAAKNAAYHKAMEWAKVNGYDISKYPYPNNRDSEVIAREWCEMVKAANS